MMSNNIIQLLPALEGVRQASLFEELNAATPSWAAARVPGSILTPSDGSKRVIPNTMAVKTKEVLSSLVDKCENSSLPPSMILNLVNSTFFVVIHSWNFGLWIKTKCEIYKPMICHKYLIAVNSLDETVGDVDSGNSTPHSLYRLNMQGTQLCDILYCKLWPLVWCRCVREKFFVSWIFSPRKYFHLSREICFSCFFPLKPLKV